MSKQYLNSEVNSTAADSHNPQDASQKLYGSIDRTMKFEGAPLTAASNLLNAFKPNAPVTEDAAHASRKPIQLLDLEQQVKKSDAEVSKFSDVSGAAVFAATTVGSALKVERDGEVPSSGSFTRGAALVAGVTGIEAAAYVTLKENHQNFAEFFKPNVVEEALVAFAGSMGGPDARQRAVLVGAAFLTGRVLTAGEIYYHRLRDR